MVATNATGTTFGAVARFSTGPGGAPIATTGAATAVTATTATLGGTVDAQSITLPLSGLTPNTSYRYRIVATNANGTTSGTVGTFTTTGPGT